MLDVPITRSFCVDSTKDIEAHVKRADIVVAAIGRPEWVRGSWLKPGCIVIDVGINSKDDPSKKAGYRLVPPPPSYARAFPAQPRPDPAPANIGTVRDV